MNCVKKFLSILLAAVMIVSLAPVSFAAVESTAQSTYDETAASAVLSDTSKANGWQVVSGEYDSGFAYQYNETNDVRVRKEVMSTDNENEFYVYLEVGTKYAWKDILMGASKLAITTSNYNTGNIYKWGWVEGDETTSIIGNSSMLYFNKEDADAAFPTGYHTYYMNLMFYESGTIKQQTVQNGVLLRQIEQECYGTSSKCSNGSAVLYIPLIGSSLTVGPISLNADHNDGKINIPIILDKGNLNGYSFSERQVIPGDLTDTMGGTEAPMGSYIQLEELVTYDGTAGADTDASGYQWILNSEGVKTTETGSDGLKVIWNTQKMLYKISLDTSKEGFYSCAEHLSDSTGETVPIDLTDWIYETNDETVFNYTTKISQKDGTVVEEPGAFNITSPQVRGLLYDVSFQKVGIKASDSSAQSPLAGAQFGVYDSNGDAVLRDSQPYTVTSGQDGTVCFSSLPCGTYTVRELLPPDGYSKPSVSQWQMTLCYTTDSQSLEQDTDDFVRNMRYKGNDTASGIWTVANTAAEPAPDVVVLDYGKSISVDPTLNDGGSFGIDGLTVNAPSDGVMTADSVKLNNGVATVDGYKIVYSPFTYMNSIDRVYYYLTSRENPTKNSESTQKEFYSTVTFIPATTVYYEDNFGGSSENGGLYINYTGDWFTVSDDGTSTSGVTANTDTTDRQDNGEVGQGNTPYGNDSSYADDIKFSNGTAAQATGSVSLVNGRPQFDASASFDFTGTGFDIISRTDLDCGMITVYIVDSNGKATNVPVINKGSNTLYQIPVISYTGLSYGTYTVTINVNAPVTALGITGSVFYLDAIRIYDPMGTSSADNAEFNEANAAYNADHEANAYVASIRDYILQVGKLDETETYGAVWVDTINNDYNGGGFIEQSSIKDFELTGPNEEVYLSPGYGIGFIVESTSIPDSVQLEIKVPAPLKNGARLSVQTIGKSNVTNFDVTSASEMFYDISDAVVFTPTTVNGTTLYRATVILANGLPSEDAGEIVSITNIKMTYDDAKAVVATDSVSALTLDAETVEELDETQTEAVALKASWNVYVDVFDTVYTQHQASLPEYSVSSAETEGTVKSGQTVKATVKTSRYVDALTVSDEYGSQAKITKVTSSVDESKILTEEYKTAKTWNIEFTVYGSNGTKAYTVSSANGEGETAQLDVTIENPTVESIKVYSKPNKTTYKYGESFDSTGMTLLVTYSDSTTKIIDSGYAVSPEKFTKTGTQKVTVSYGGKQTTVNVRVTYSLLQFVLKLLNFGLLWKM